MVKHFGNENKMFASVHKYHIKSEGGQFNCAGSISNGYNCNICSFTCDLKIDLFGHSVGAHNVEIKHDLTDMKNFNCKKCNFQTYSLLIFYTHHCKPWGLKIEKAGNLYFESFTCASILAPYKCKNCDFYTNLKILFKFHINRVHKNHAICDSSAAIDLQKSFTCARCRLQTCSIFVLYKHVCTRRKKTRKEKQLILLQCEFCNFKSKWKASLQGHVRLIHPPGKLYICKHCDHTFPQIIDLESHLSRVHSAESLKPFHCKQCDFKFKQKFNLTRHLKLMHGLVTWFKCEHCKSIFVLKSHLKKHLREEHGVKNVKLQECEFTTKSTTRTRTKQNYRKTELQQCSYCEYKTELESGLIRHLELKHSRRNKCLKCVYCGHAFSLRSELKKHLAEQHSVGKTGKRFQCEQCEYKTENIHYLKSHMLYKHTDHQKINWFKCKHCEDKFLIKGALDQHLLKVHSNKDEKWLHCEKCDYRTPFPWRFKDHVLRRHTDHQEINWFICEHCGFKTKMKSNLRLHILRRHTPMLVKCEFCPYVGNLPVDVKLHMKRKHKGEA